MLEITEEEKLHLSKLDVALEGLSEDILAKIKSPRIGSKFIVTDDSPLIDLISSTTYYRHCYFVELVDYTLPDTIEQYSGRQNTIVYTIGQCEDAVYEEPTRHSWQVMTIERDAIPGVALYHYKFCDNGGKYVCDLEPSFGIRIVTYDGKTHIENIDAKGSVTKRREE